MNQPASNGPTVSFDEFGPLEIRPQPGQVWCHTDHPKRLPATYTRPHGVQHWLAFYDVHQKKLWGYVRPRKRHQEFLGVLKAVKEEVSEKSANSPDIGQLLATPQSEGVAVLSTEQYSSDLDTDKCFMAQSYRMSIYACEGICNSWDQL